MYLYISIYLSIYIYIHIMYIYIYIHTSLYLHLHLCRYRHLYPSPSTDLSIYTASGLLVASRSCTACGKPPSVRGDATHSMAGNFTSPHLLLPAPASPAHAPPRAPLYDYIQYYCPCVWAGGCVGAWVWVFACVCVCVCVCFVCVCLHVCVWCVCVSVCVITPLPGF